MASGERTHFGPPREADRLALAREWRKLARAATFVAILTSPATFAFFHLGHDWPVIWALLGTLAFVIVLRGAIDVIAHKLIPRASLYGAGRELQQEDIIDRRRVWYWRTRFRRFFWFALFVGLPLIVLATQGIYPRDIIDGFIQFLPYILLYGIQIPLLFFANLFIIFGPMLYFGVKQMKGYEPGDADWGVKLDDVRGQDEPKEEVTKVIDLWSAGEDFRKAG
ncbi:MAG: hypothetical protein ACXWZZ_04650, partial [Solirubrobacteraceae bacterium]